MSAVPPCKFAHVLDQHVDPFRRHGIIEARAHAPDGAMTLEIDQAGLARSGDEALVQFRPCQREGHVHPGAARWRDRIAIKIRLVHGPLELPGFGPVAVSHALPSTLTLSPPA